MKPGSKTSGGDPAPEPLPGDPPSGIPQGRNGESESDVLEGYSVDKYIGAQIIAFGTVQLDHAVALVAGMPTEALRAMKIRSGEHLAALLLTCVFLTPPSSTGAFGTVDLTFEVTEGDLSGLDRPGMVAVEVKSCSGAFREHDAVIDRIRARGGSARALVHEVRVSTMASILDDAAPLIERAATKVLSTGADSRHVFLVVHPFDRMAAEPVNELLVTPFLEPPDLPTGIDVLWVLWWPSHLVFWSTEHSTWTQVLVVPSNDEAMPPQATLNPFDDAEAELLARWPGGPISSPFHYGLTASPPDRGADDKRP